MSASEHEHLSLYKSKSGHHSSRLGPRERLHNERKVIRNKNRHEAFIAQRVIEPTPLKAKSAGSQPQTATSTNKQSVLSRQKAFVERFAEYRAKRENAKQAKQKPVPFVTSVPVGRIVNTNARPNDVAARPKYKRVMQLTSVKGGEQTTNAAQKTKFSPINTRSRNRRLMSPAKLLTPKRKKRVEAVEVKKAVTRAILPLNGAPKPIVTTKSVPTVKVQPMPAQRPMLCTKPPNSIQAAKAPPKLSSRPIASVKKEQAKMSSTQGFNFKNAAKIPPKFDFNHVDKATTSTVMKPRTVKTADSNRKSSKKLFEDSFSPIETDSPKKTSKRVSSAKRSRRSIIQATSRDETRAADDVAAEQNEPKEKEVEVDLNQTPEPRPSALDDSVNYLSPFVTITRGKIRSAKKEVEARETKYKLESRKSVDLNASTGDRQNREAARYFRMQMKREAERLMALVDKWQLAKETDAATIPGEYIDLIDVTIGQTRLLTANKFEQFRGLVDKCEACNTESPVRPEDLEGFWGMVYMQVENCDKRFDRLDKIKANGWQDPELVPTKVKKIRSENPISKSKPKAVRTGNPALEKILREARRRHRENALANDNGVVFAMGKLAPSNRLNSSGARVSTPRRSIWVVSSLAQQKPFKLPYIPRVYLFY